MNIWCEYQWPRYHWTSRNSKWHGSKRREFSSSLSTTVIYWRQSRVHKVDYTFSFSFLYIKFVDNVAMDGKHKTNGQLPVPHPSKCLKRQPFFEASHFSCAFFHSGTKRFSKEIFYNIHTGQYLVVVASVCEVAFSIKTKIVFGNWLQSRNKAQAELFWGLGTSCILCKRSFWLVLSRGYSLLRLW